jgi:hypothetical protein
MKIIFSFNKMELTRQVNYACSNLFQQYLTDGKPVITIIQSIIIIAQLLLL